ncbi:MAG TPA: hypothetical protein VMU34_08500 [Mycobacterium sp.]|nr:hypothetical protein [Mycobacterium sp.]
MADHEVLNDSTPSSPDRVNNKKRPVSTLVRRIAMATVTGGAVLGLTALASPAPAGATTGGCWGGSCDVYLSPEETQEMAQNPGWYPPPPQWLDPSLMGQYQDQFQNTDLQLPGEFDGHQCAHFRLRERDGRHRGFERYHC